MGAVRMRVKTADKNSSSSANVMWSEKRICELSLQIIATKTIPAKKQVLY